MTLTRESRRIAGLLLLSIVAIESGGYYLTRIVSGAVEVTDFQLGFSRAGHAHAGVLVTLSLIAIVLADAADTALVARRATGAHGAGRMGMAGWIARLGIPTAAILMPAGFFFSSMGAGRTEPNGLIVLLWLGAASLAAGVLTLGVRLLLSTKKAPASAMTR
jgi:hypothetical protein